MPRARSSLAAGVSVPGASGAPFDMNVARRRLLAATEQVKAVTARSAGSDLGDAVRSAFVDYQHAAEDRRMLGADVGEAVVRLVDAMTAAGYSEQQARNADVWALRDGSYRGR